MTNCCHSACLCVHKDSVSTPNCININIGNEVKYFLTMSSLPTHSSLFFPGHGLLSAGTTDFGNTWSVASQSGDSGDSGHALSEKPQEDDRSPGEVRTSCLNHLKEYCTV